MYSINALQLLGDITSAQQSYADRSDERIVFDRLLEAVLRATRSEYGFIGRFLEDEQGRYLKTLAITNIAWDAETRALYAASVVSGFEFRNLNTLFGKVVRTGEMLIANDAPNHPDSGGVPKGHPPLRSFAGVPLSIGGKRLGMVGVANSPEGYCVELFEALGPLLATVAQIIQGLEDRRLREQSEERLSAVVALAPDAILTVDRQGLVLEANTHAQHLIGGPSQGLYLPGLFGLSELPAPNQPVLCSTQTEPARAVELSVGEPVTGKAPFSVVIVRDVTERERIRQALADSENRWQQAIQGSTDGVWDWDLLTNDVYFSPRWMEMLGYGPTELPHRISTFFDLIHPEDAPGVEAEAKKHIAGRSAQYTVEFRLRHKSGEWRWVLARGRVLTFTGDGLPWRFMGTHVDIHEARLQAEQLREAKEAAESAARAKAAFLANMSHEIRTPMNAIVAAAHLLETTVLSTPQTEFVQIIRGSAGSLLGLVNDVLDFSKIESGRLQLETVDFSLKDLVQALESSHRLETSKKGLTLHSIVDPRLPGLLRGDPTRLRQILTNLLSNAIKFTLQGEIRLFVEVAALDEETAVVRFQVSDTGIGIERHMLNKIFHPFEQAEDSTTRRFGGTGLGLSISLHLVEQMGGQLEVESTKDVGSRFQFELKLPVSNTQAAAAPEEKPGAIEGRVLLVEDNAVNEKLMRYLLRNFTKCEIGSARNGLEAIQMVRQDAYDLILMDCQMPELDGYQATAAIRAMPGPPGLIPIIALTANAFSEDRERCLAVGMNDFLTKPIDLPRLVNTLGKWLPPQPGRAGERGGSA